MTTTQQKASEKLELFEVFWKAYPRKIKKRDATKAWYDAVEDGADPKIIMEGVSRYKLWLDMADKDTWRPEPCYPGSWLRAGRWEDEYEGPKNEGIVRIGETMSQARSRLEREGKALLREVK